MALHKNDRQASSVRTRGVCSNMFSDSLMFSVVLSGQICLNEAQFADFRATSVSPLSDLGTMDHIKHMHRNGGCQRHLLEADELKIFGYLFRFFFLLAISRSFFGGGQGIRFLSGGNVCYSHLTS